MRTGPRKAAAASGDHRLRVAARTLAFGVLLAFAILFYSATGKADPASQFTVAQSGVRLRLGSFALGSDWVTMTVIVENQRDDPVWLAALAGREDPDAALAVLSDDHDKSCKAAANPAGISEISPFPSRKPAEMEAAMTEIGAHDGTKVVFDFAHCRLSRSSLLSLAATFGLSTDGHRIDPFPVRFWGIVQKTRMR